MELSKGYKEPETGIFPIDWEFKAVDELGTVVTGGTPSTSVKEYWGGSIPWVTPTDISRSRDMYSSDRMLSESGLRVIRALPANSVLVTCIASIGKNAILKTAGGCNQQINAVIPNDSDSDFLYYLFEKNKPILLASAGTTATSIISKKVFEKLVFSIPKIIEQRKISATLSDVDALIAGLEKLIAKKRDLKQAAMQQLLTGQTRLPGFSGEWVVKRLGDLAEMGSGGTPSSANGAYYGGDIPWVAIADMTCGGKYIARTERNLSVLGLANSAAQMFPAGTVLYAMYASLGECSIATVPVTTSQAILGIRPKADLHSEFLYYLLTSWKSMVKGLGQQGTQANLNKGIVADFKVLLPSFEEQESIAAVLVETDTELVALEIRLAKTCDLKQGMMQELLTGRTRLV
jgi:type I restriction enzyme S subunit